MPEYPDTIEYAIDRKRLARCWRLQSLLALTIPGIIDAQKVRDELCAIDAMREEP